MTKIYLPNVSFVLRALENMIHFSKNRMQAKNPTLIIWIIHSCLDSYTILVDKCLERNTSDTTCWILHQYFQIYYLFLEIDMSCIFCLYKTESAHPFLWYQAHLDLSSPCNFYGKVKISITYEISLLIQIKWEPSNNFSSMLRGKYMEIHTSGSSHLLALIVFFTHICFILRI